MLQLGLRNGLPRAYECTRTSPCLCKPGQMLLPKHGRQQQQHQYHQVQDSCSSRRIGRLGCSALPKPGSANNSNSSSSRFKKRKQSDMTAAAPADSDDYEDDDSADYSDLAADDNIFLLGSEDEEDDDYNMYLAQASSQASQPQQLRIRGQSVSADMTEDDFAAAMAAAQRQVHSGSSDDDEDGWGLSAAAADVDDDWATMRSTGEDFWSSDRERVFLVGVTYKQQQQQRQQQQQQQYQRRTSLFNRSGSSNKRPLGGLGMAVEVADDAYDSSGSSGRGAAGAHVSYSVQESLEELGRLAETAGLQVVGSSYQALESPNNATYIGSGKVAEVSRAIEVLKVDTVIFDDELSPGQLRNLEKTFNSAGGKERRQVAVADRTALILDIFSQRARTREGKLQVELAQTEYQLPRLTRMWTHLDRVSGGGQVKGAGEKQIEIDKRLLRDKAAALRRELQAVRTHRAAHRARRADAPVPVVALVGYTNAGKSTLLNTLTDAGVLAEDKLFATLDPTTRRVRLGGNLEVLFSDTVGFIQKLPTQLVAAFRATLEEIAAAAVVLHVLDVSAPNAAAQCAAVLQVLEDLGVQELPLVTAWNKVDACPDPAAVKALAAGRPDTVSISGASGEGLDQLLTAIAQKLAEQMVEVEALLPYSAGALLDEVHKMGKVSDTQYTEKGTQVVAHVPRCLLGKLTPYLVAESVLNEAAAAAAGVSADSLEMRYYGSILDDGDNGQLSMSDIYDDGYIDFEVDNRSYEDAAAAATAGRNWTPLSAVDNNEAWQAAAAAGWPADDTDDERSGAAKGAGQSDRSSSYRPHVAGSRAGKRAAKQQRQQQQNSLSQHQLPAGWQDLVMQQPASSSR